MDYLTQRTTNINIRISPVLKTQLIESGARQGLNLSDYVMHILTVEMSGKNQPEVLDITTQEEYQDLLEMLNEETHNNQILQQEKAELQKQLKVYEDLQNSFRPFIGQTLIVDDEHIKVSTTLDVLKLIVKLFKFKQLK